MMSIHKFEKEVVVCLNVSQRSPKQTTTKPTELK
jgi:hypothetical protein